MPQITPSSSLSVNNETISFSSRVRNLGVILDNTLSMNAAISKTKQACYLQLRRISRIRPFISENAAKQLVLSFVVSKLDYCNSLFYSITSENLDKLQSIQNNAARLVKKASKQTNALHLLEELHWLPIRARITFKIATFVFSALNTINSPVYLKELISPYRPSRPLRSQTKNLLEKPVPSLSFGKRAFTFSGPEIWNSLPDSVKSSDSLCTFKSRLKTHLFVESFF